MEKGGGGARETTGGGGHIGVTLNIGRAWVVRDGIGREYGRLAWGRGTRKDETS